MPSLGGLSRHFAVLATAGLILSGVALVAVSCDRRPTPVTGDDMSIGDPAAPVTLVEYASVTCAHCADFNQHLMPRIEDKYVRTGKVRYVYREFLTPPNDVSAQGVLLARCAGRDKYFKVIDAIMASQDEMFSGDDTALPVLLGIAKQIGLTEVQFRACITDAAGIARLQANVEKYAQTDHVESAPTFFVNGRKLERHTGELAEFDAAIAPYLSRK